MSEENQKPNRSPSHIAYQVREGEDNKAYFNRVGSVWPHKDGKGWSMQLDSLPVDGRVVVRSVQERLQEAKDTARDGREAGAREERSGDKRGSGREDRSPRDAGLRYER